MWVRSWFKHGVMGELTPGTQLSMGSAKRLYVLLAGFYMQRPFKTSAVKWRHQIVAFRSPVMPHVSAGTSCCFINAAWATQPLMCPWHGPQFCKLYSMCTERRDSHRSATGSLRSDSHDHGGAQESSSQCVRRYAKQFTKVKARRCGWRCGCMLPLLDKLDY